MCIVPPSPRIASAYAVHFGPYGAITQLARQRGVCRQWLYREAAWVSATLAGTASQADRQDLHQRLRELEQQLKALQRRLDRAVDPGREFTRQVRRRQRRSRGVAGGESAGVGEPRRVGAVRSGRPTRVAGWSPGAPAVVDELTPYFSEQRAHLDYAGRLAQGRPIGSGMIGATAKSLGKRLKQSGARWEAANVPGMAPGCSLRHSTHGDASWSLN